MLTGKEILSLVKEKDMIKPFVNDLISVININGKDYDCPSFGLSYCGYDVTLQPVLKRIIHTTYTANNRIDLLNIKNTTKYIECDFRKSKDWWVIEPGEFILAATNEYIKMPKDVSASLYCKSTLARLGLILPPTIIEPGWEGNIVVEIFNASDKEIQLYPNIGIGQLVFFKLNELTRGYRGKYQGQTGITEAR